MLDGSAGSLIQHEFPLGWHRVTDPALPGGNAVTFAEKQRADIVPAHDLVQHIRPLSVGDHDIHADRGRRVHGFQLGLHPPRSARTLRSPDQVQKFIIELFDEWQTTAGGIGRITCQQAINDRQNDQKVCLNQSCDHCSQPVVITQLDLFGADGVILIDDRNHRKFCECSQSIADVQIARSLLEIIRCQQDLRRVITMRLQCLVVDMNQVCLARCRCGLKMRQVLRTLLEA